jgi:hypothetical protein
MAVNLFIKKIKAPLLLLKEKELEDEVKCL